MTPPSAQCHPPPRHGVAVVLRADARQLPLPDASVDLIVTSPPYLGLRSYTDGGEHYDGQIGSESTPAGYVAALIDCTREWMRVLKPAGSIFVNIGDKYNSAASGHDGPLHTCCQYWAAELTAGRGCPACIASRMSRTRKFAYTVIDRRAIASGKRRSSLTAYRQAQAEEAATKEGA